MAQIFVSPFSSFFGRLVGDKNAVVFSFVILLSSTIVIGMLSNIQDGYLFFVLLSLLRFL